MLSYLLVDTIPGEPLVQTVIRQPLFFGTVLLSYHYFVRKSGPAWMAQRQAFDLRTVMLAYNAFQVLFNLALFIHTLYTITAQGKTVLQCIESDAHNKLNLLLYVLNKYTDLADTVIFVLRKKQNQVTFLHVHHHLAIIMWTTWTLYYPGYTDGGSAIVIGANVFVHVLMYSYYFATIYSAEWRTRLAPLKRRLTQVQLLQFVLLICHFSRDVFGVCTQVIWGLSLGGLLQNIFFLYLFGNMYHQQYLRPQRAQAKAD